MDFARYLAAIRADGERLAAAAELGLDAAVPSCPGWTVADLVAHTGVVHRHKEQIVREGWQDGEPGPVAAPSDDLLAWYRQGLRELLDTLDAHDPSERVASWYPDDQSVGFWYRRMAAETVVHRIDAELAHGAVTPVAAELAIDAIDEVLTVFMAGYPDWSRVAHSGNTMRIETLDGDESWTVEFVTFEGTSPVTGTTYAKEPSIVFSDDPVPSTRVTGAAEDVLLYLWGRRSADGLRVTGDPGLLADLRRIAADVT